MITGNLNAKEINALYLEQVAEVTSTGKPIVKETFYVDVLIDEMINCAPLDAKCMAIKITSDDLMPPDAPMALTQNVMASLLRCKSQVDLVVLELEYSGATDWSRAISFAEQLKIAVSMLPPTKDSNSEEFDRYNDQVGISYLDTLSNGGSIEFIPATNYTEYLIKSAHGIEQKVLSTDPYINYRYSDAMAIETMDALKDSLYLKIEEAFGGKAEMQEWLKQVETAVFENVSADAKAVVNQLQLDARKVVGDDLIFDVLNAKGADDYTIAAFAFEATQYFDEEIFKHVENKGAAYIKNSFIPEIGVIADAIASQALFCKYDNIPTVVSNGFISKSAFQIKTSADKFFPRFQSSYKNVIDVDSAAFYDALKSMLVAAFEVASHRHIPKSKKKKSSNIIATSTE